MPAHGTTGVCGVLAGIGSAAGRRGPGDRAVVGFPARPGVVRAGRLSRRPVAQPARAGQYEVGKRDARRGGVRVVPGAADRVAGVQRGCYPRGHASPLIANMRELCSAVVKVSLHIVSRSRYRVVGHRYPKYGRARWDDSYLPPPDNFLVSHIVGNRDTWIERIWTPK